MRNLSFTFIAFNEYNKWFEDNIKMVQRIKELIKDIDRDPFKGIGKPEPLKGNWSVIGAGELITNIDSYIKLHTNKY